MFSRATIRLGIGPHSSYSYFYSLLLPVLPCILHALSQLRCLLVVLVQDCFKGSWDTHKKLHKQASKYGLMFINSTIFNGHRCKQLFVDIYITPLCKTMFHIFRTLIYFEFRS